MSQMMLCRYCTRRVLRLRVVAPSGAANARSRLEFECSPPLVDELAYPGVWHDRAYNSTRFDIHPDPIWAIGAGTKAADRRRAVRLKKRRGRR